MNEHTSALIEEFPELEICGGQIEKAFEAMKKCYRQGGKVLLCGNGGSAADCEHISGELMKGFRKRRPLPAEMKGKLPHALADSLQQGLPAIPLPGLTSLNTAFANDVDADLVYAQGVWALGVAGDLLVGISTSGNAKNVIAAVQAARAKGILTIGLTGSQGGLLGSEAEIVIRVPAEETHRVQQYHLPVYHCLCLMLEDEFFG